MKYSIVLLFSLFAFTQSAFCQIEPVKWSIDTVQSDGKIEVIVIADIQDTWKIYSNTTEEGGPIPTDIVFESEAQMSTDYREKRTPKSYQSELFDMKVSTFADQAIFVQSIDEYKSGTVVTATVTYMCCSGDQCLPPTDVVLEITL